MDQIPRKKLYAVLEYGKTSSDILEVMSMKFFILPFALLGGGLIISIFVFFVEYIILKK